MQTINNFQSSTPEPGFRPRQIVFYLVPCLIYLLSMALLGSWIVDDAAISYAYARNLAAGHGFVSQPGQPPVEGFSNFLWVVILTPLFWLRIFDPVVIVKCLSTLLVFCSFVILNKTVQPNASFSDVARNFAFKYNHYADALGLKNASVFIYDIGATFYYSRLKVYDGAGLCEPEVVRTLKQGTGIWQYNHPDFYDYIFEKIKPTFICTHRFFTNITGFDLDPRFARDYTAIDAFYEWDKAILAGERALLLEPDNTLAKNNLALAISRKRGY
jgi:hypothetical protein